MFPTKTMITKQITTLLTLATLLIAGRAIHAQAPVAMGADVPELMQQIEENKRDPYTDIVMEGKNLQGAQLAKADLSRAAAIFRNSDLSNANLSGAQLTNVDFTRANLTHVNFSDAHLNRIRFDKCIGFNSTILNSKTIFSYVEGLTDEEIAYARSKGVIIKLPGKDLSRLKTLNESVYSDAPINMPNADLKNSNLSVFALQKANLAGADLSGSFLGSPKVTCFAGDQCIGFKLTTFSTPLVEANVSGANLTDADLQYGAFTSTNFSGAKLTNANLSGANLTKANFTNCKGFETTIINNETNFKDAIGLTPEQKAYARSKGAQNVPN